jgi:cell division protein ZapA (FtsZ GTPase activity inhibitor)
MGVDRIEVILGRQKYRLRSTAENRLANRAVELASELVRKVSERTPQATQEQLLLMAYLDLAEEYVRSKEEWVKLREELLQELSE